MDMLNLGGFVFSIAEKTPYAKLSRITSGGWQSVPIYSGRPLRFNFGRPGDRLRLSGEWFYKEGMAKLDELRALQAEEKPLLLTDSYGNNLGRWTLDQITDNQDDLISDGTALSMQWTLELESYHND
ncbi:phage tail protein [Alteromonadaceae bacterium M269]|nr:phage tail protein [Alteromonadaceae bacterium M269]